MSKEVKDDKQKLILNKNLLEAASKGDRDTVIYLLKADADIETRDEDDRTPLHLAAINNHLDVANTLLEYKADINSLMNDKGTPIFDAVVMGHDDMVKLLLENKANVELTDERDWNLLHWAVSEGRLSTAKLLLDRCPFLANKTKSNGLSPLHFAAEKDNLSMVKLLVAAKAHITALDDDEDTPITIAAQNGHPHIAEYLQWCQSKQTVSESKESDLAASSTGSSTAGTTATTSVIENKKDGPTWILDKNHETHQLQRDPAQRAVKVQLHRQHLKFKKEPHSTLYQILNSCDIDAKYLDLSGNALNDRDALCLTQFLQICPHKLETLRLSHNCMTSEGLEMILKACVKKSTLQFLLFDHNHIDFERHFCENILEPSIVETNLRHLDLSMNFIYEGEVLEQKSISGTPVKIVRGEILERELTKEKEQHCKLFLQNSFVVKSNCLSHSLPSILNPEKMIDRDCGVVSLLAFKTTLPPFGEHAFLGIEGIHDFGQRYIMMAELFETPKGVKVYLTYCSPQEYQYRTKDGERIHRRSAQVKIGKINKLKKIILNDRNNEEFIKYALLPDNRKGVYNCLTWAVGILDKIKIEMELGRLPSQTVKQDSGDSSVGRCVIS